MEIKWATHTRTEHYVNGMLTHEFIERGPPTGEYSHLSVIHWKEHEWVVVHTRYPSVEHVVNKNNWLPPNTTFATCEEAKNYAAILHLTDPKYRREK